MDCQVTSHFSASQCDFPSITGPISPAPIYVGVSCPAKRLLPQQRQDLAIQVLARTETVSELARQHEVDRKFFYQQVHTAEKVLSEAFAPSRNPTTSFSICRSPRLGCGNWSWPWCSSAIVRPAAWSNCSATSSIFGSPWGPCTTSCTAPLLRPGGSTSSTTSPPSSSASSMRSSRRDPVLVGVDAQSTFCFLLSPEEHRDADTWGVRLLELVDQGFAPKATIADFGSGLRAGHQEVLPEVPCRGDVFHALYHTGPLVRYLENRAYEAMNVCVKLERKQATTARRRGCKDQSLATKLSYARPAEAKAIVLADEVALLARWLRDDILSVAGPEYAIRRDLFDFVVAEFAPRVGLSASDRAGKDLAGETAG